MTRPIRIGPTPTKWPEFLRELDGERTEVPAHPKDILKHIFTSNWKTLILAVVFSALHFVAMAMLPWAVGGLLDSGIESGLHAVILPWVWLTIGIIALAALGSFNEPVMIGLWLHGTWEPVRWLLNRVSRRRTDASQKMASGDIVASVTTDGDKLGAVAAFVPDAVGSAIAFVIVAVLMLQVSVPLGLFVLIGMPLLLFGISRIIKPLQEKIAIQREELGNLTSLASDAVVGLRVLRGVGGEDVYNEKYVKQSTVVQEAGIRTAKYRAMLNAIQTAGPALFTAIVVGGGLYLTFNGSMSPGQLFSFYGYTVFLAMPIGAISQTIQMGTRAWVGAKKIGRVIAAQPLVDDDGVVQYPHPRDWSRTALTDEKSGVRIDPGKITALVAASPLETSGIGARLARVDDANITFADDTDLRSYPVDEVREHIVLSGSVAELFTGSLRSGLMGPDAPEVIPRSIEEQVTDIQQPGGEGRALFEKEDAETLSVEDQLLIDALNVADGADVVTSVDGGLEGQIAERGRSLSGGQRQRVALARVIAQDPDIVVLIEPTSAVDSHTEARIANNLARARHGKTTVIVTASPLVLDRCDEIVLVAEGHEIARGPHHELLDNPDYYRVVHRGVGEEAE